MIQRRAGDTNIFITQTAHAWLTGQIGRVWGNEKFQRPLDKGSVYLAAEQHDIGWAGWEVEPGIDPATGKPFDFMCMPTYDHVDIWTRGSKYMFTQSPYASLLVSRHNLHLAKIHDYSRDTPDEVAAMKRFIADEKQRYEMKYRQLSRVPAYRKLLDEKVMEFHRKQILVWDYLSLLFCMGMEPGNSELVSEVPINSASDTKMHVSAVSHTSFSMDPWPFATQRIRLSCDARRITGRYKTGNEFLNSEDAGNWQLFEVELIPANH